MYYTSLKSRHTSKFRHLRNVNACFCQFTPINATLEILPHGKGLIAICICICTRTLYMNTNSSLLKLCTCVHVDICRHRLYCTKWGIEIKSHQGNHNYLLHYHTCAFTITYALSCCITL